nr:DUF3422 family protein [Escherichia coli]
MDFPFVFLRPLGLRLRLLEIENYRTLALLSLPLTRTMKSDRSHVVL